MSQKKLIIVSNRLPLQIHMEDGQWRVLPSGGGLASALGGIKGHLSFDWVGWPGTEIPKKDQGGVRELLESERYYPVFLTATEIERFYNGFSNRVLWPLFHYLPNRVDFSLRYWDYYQEVNRHFAEQIASLCTDESLVWIHDYHLFLVPALLRAKKPSVKIGFFLHVPFPSSELYRLLPVRKEILQGLLGSDLIGFHSHDYLRHFEMTCLRVLGLESSPEEINYDQRRIHLNVYPIGINPGEFLSTLGSEECSEKQIALQTTYADKKLILGVDRLDYIKGLSLKFKAFEVFLENYPEWRERVVLLQVVVPSRSGVRDYKEMKNELDNWVGRINGRFSTPHHTPISYLAQSISFHELCALYSRADILLVTSIRDGMNLVSLEYSACKKGIGGVLILSEFTGAAHSLSHALLVNPWDTHHVAETIHNALIMDESEQLERAAHHFNYVQRFNSIAWARRFIKDLQGSFEEPSHHALHLGHHYIPLHRAYMQASERLIFLDYDGTLMAFTPLPDKAAPPPALSSLLTELCRDHKNHVLLVSGRTATQLEEWFEKIPNLGLCAEHGLFLKEPGESNWQPLYQNGKNWMPVVKPILDDYVDRTPGALLEVKTHSIAWHYRRSDEEFGEWQAHELGLHLEQSLANLPVQVLYGNKVIEVRAQGVHKGLAVNHVLAHVNNPHAFTLCFGDDLTDEDMFAALPKESWSCRIGDDRTCAQFFLNSCDQVIDILAELASTKE